MASSLPGEGEGGEGCRGAAAVGGGGMGAQPGRHGRVPVSQRPVSCSTCGGRCENQKAWRKRCLNGCARSVPIPEAGDPRVWHRCEERGVYVMSEVHPTCGDCGLSRVNALRAAECTRNAWATRARPGGEAGRGLEDVVRSPLIMALVRAAVGKPALASPETRRLDAALRAVRMHDFDALVPRVRAVATTDDAVPTDWNGTSYLDEDVLLKLVYGAESGVSLTASAWEYRHDIDVLALHCDAARALVIDKVPAGAAGSGLDGGGAGDTGGVSERPSGGSAHDADAPRAVQRVDAVRWPAGLDVHVSAEELTTLFEKRGPRAWVQRRHRELWGELVVRALHAAAGGGEGTMRALLALPRLALGCRSRIRERCLLLLGGGEGARSVVEEALEAEDDDLSGEYDPLARAAQLAKLGQTVDALRVAYAAEAGDMEGEEVDGAAGAGTGATGATAPPRKTHDELVAALLPQHEGAPDAEATAQVAAMETADARPEVLDKINWEAVLRALQPGKAAGLDGWRNEHLLSLLGAGRDLAQRVTEAMAAFGTKLMAGDVQPEERCYLSAARVVMIPKKDGSPRPLGVVSALRRLVCRAAVRALVPQVTAWLVQRGQLGVGAPAGTEALARIVQRALDKGMAVLAVDRTNAYGLLRPEPAVAALGKLVPELLPLLQMLLDGDNPALVMGDGVRRRFSGLFMGCPLSPLLYAVGIELSVDLVRGAIYKAGVSSRGFLDDGILAGWEAGALEAAFRDVQSAGERWGQKINVRKCVIILPAGKVHDFKFTGALADIPCVTATSIVGVPVGESVACKEACMVVVRRATAARRALARRLPALAAYYTLRKADGLPVLVHMLRALPTSLTAEAAAEHDRDVEQEMAKFAGTVPDRLGPLRPMTWMPLRLGGRAVASAVTTAPAAFVAATVQVNRIEVSIAGHPDNEAFCPDGMPAFYLPRVSGRPTPGWGGGATSGLCGGPARCRMPSVTGCARACCTPCCAAQGGCHGCNPHIEEAKASREALWWLADAGVRAAIQLAAEQSGLSEQRVENAYAAAAEYAAPQRAMTCALMGVRFKTFLETIQSDDRLMRVRQACAHPCAYASSLVSPLASRMADGVFLVAVRGAYALPILSPTALYCRTLAGREGKRCPLKGIRPDQYAEHAAAHPHAADDHVMVCKSGGKIIQGHDGMVRAYSSTGVGWGVTVRMERTAHLPPNMRIDADVPLAGDPGTMGLEVDFTRIFNGGQQLLRAAELRKQKKYDEKFEASMTVRGAAFNQFGELGPGAREVVDRMVRIAVHTTGSHPDDLRLEILAAMGHAVHYANAAAYAHFRELNNDYAGFAPLKSALVQRGQVLATGVAGRLSRARGRGRPLTVAGARKRVEALHRRAVRDKIHEEGAAPVDMREEVGAARAASAENDVMSVDAGQQPGGVTGSG